MVRSDDGTVEYRFAARVLALTTGRSTPDSITRHARRRASCRWTPWTSVIELRGTLGLTDEILPVYLEEITSTLSGTAYKLGQAADAPPPSWPTAGLPGHRDAA